MTWHYITLQIYTHKYIHTHTYTIIYTYTYTYTYIYIWKMGTYKLLSRASTTHCNRTASLARCSCAAILWSWSCVIPSASARWEFKPMWNVQKNGDPPEKRIDIDSLLRFCWGFGILPVFFFGVIFGGWLYLNRWFPANPMRKDISVWSRSGLGEWLTRRANLVLENAWQCHIFVWLEHPPSMFGSLRSTFLVRISQQKWECKTV